MHTVFILVLFTPQIILFSRANMAPRGRTRTRNTRMDAAVDAMGRMGFKERIVRAKVKELLKVYGGDVGWPFIEDDAYKELIDILIQPSEEKAEDSDEDNGEGSQLQNSTQEQESPAAMTSNAIANSERIGPGVVQAVSECSITEAIENVAPRGSCLPPVTRMEREPPQSAEGNGNNWKDISLDQSYGQKETAVEVSNIANNLFAEISTINPSPTNAICVQPANHLAIRRPCYGWLDCDEGELDFIYLTPATRMAPIESERSAGTANKRIRHKSRWDLTPDDP